MDLDRTVLLARTAFGRLQTVLKSKIPNTLGARTCILPVLNFINTNTCGTLYCTLRNEMLETSND